MRRRRFLTRASGALAWAVALGGAWPGCRPRTDGGDAARTPVLDAAQRRQLEAACGRILPDDEEPGAGQAGVVDAIDRSLADPALASVRARVVRGLAALDRLATTQHGRPFADLAVDVQDALFGQVQRGVTGLPDFDGAAFFDQLLRLTLEGFLGDPVHGGNRDGVGWRFAGFVPCPWGAPGHRRTGRGPS